MLWKRTLATPQNHIPHLKCEVLPVVQSWSSLYFVNTAAVLQLFLGRSSEQIGLSVPSSHRTAAHGQPQYVPKSSLYALARQIFRLNHFAKWPQFSCVVRIDLMKGFRNTFNANEACSLDLVLGIESLDFSGFLCRREKSINKWICLFFLKRRLR